MGGPWRIEGRALDCVGECAAVEPRRAEANQEGCTDAQDDARRHGGSLGSRSFGHLNGCDGGDGCLRHFFHYRLSELLQLLLSLFHVLLGFFGMLLGLLGLLLCLLNLLLCLLSLQLCLLGLLLCLCHILLGLGLFLQGLLVQLLLLQLQFVLLLDLILLPLLEFTSVDGSDV